DGVVTAGLDHSGKRLAAAVVGRTEGGKWGPVSGRLGTSTSQASIEKCQALFHPVSSKTLLDGVRGSVAGHPSQAIGNLVRIEHERVFEWRAEGHGGNIRAGNPTDGGVEAGTAAPSELSRNLGSNTHGGRC